MAGYEHILLELRRKSLLFRLLEDTFIVANGETVVGVIQLGRHISDDPRAVLGDSAEMGQSKHCSRPQGKGGRFGGRADGGKHSLFCLELNQSWDVRGSCHWVVRPMQSGEAPAW